MWDPKITISEVTDPVKIEQHRRVRESAQKNWDWFAAHQEALLPHGFGKYVAVAGQEAYLADTAEEASEWINRTHPDDLGSLLEYLMPPTGPRIYSPRI